MPHICQPQHSNLSTTARHRSHPGRVCVSPHPQPVKQLQQQQLQQQQTWPSALHHHSTPRAVNSDAPSSVIEGTRAQPARVSDAPMAAADSQQQSSLLTLEEVQQIAAARGLCITLKTLGPFYRITCRDGGPEGKVLGVTNGFVAPWFGLMHCDTLQIFTRGLKGQEGERVRKNALGLGLLLGAAVFSHGRSCGCRTAEILAINDDDAWHERLVRYYTYFGFKPVCKVGGQGFFKDLPHLLVWGGEGTRMDADIAEALQRWTPALRQSRTKAQQAQKQQQLVAGSLEPQ